jgi:signal transduction histidine kinase
MRASLGPRYGPGYPGTWDDLAAVRLAFRPGVTRSEDRDRGLGLKIVADMVRGWGGDLRLRSGTAAFVAGASAGAAGRVSGLAYFPGTQVDVRLPGAPGFSLR